MTKKELKSRISKKTNIRKAIISDIVDGVFAIITEELGKGEKVVIQDFGIFTTADTKARTAHNPHTGEEVEVQAHKKVKFKASKALKENINK